MANTVTIGPEELAATIRYMKAEEIVEAEPGEKAVITEAALAAKIYLLNAGVVRPKADTALYDLALHSLALHYYDHRDAVGNEAAIPTGLRPIITQLKLVGAVSAALEA